MVKSILSACSGHLLQEAVLPQFVAMARTFNDLEGKSEEAEVEVDKLMEKVTVKQLGIASKFSTACDNMMTALPDLATHPIASTEKEIAELDFAAVRCVMLMVAFFNQSAQQPSFGSCDSLDQAEQIWEAPSSFCADEEAVQMSLQHTVGKECLKRTAMALIRALRRAHDGMMVKVASMIIEDAETSWSNINEALTKESLVELINLLESGNMNDRKVQLSLVELSGAGVVAELYAMFKKVTRLCCFRDDFGSRIAGLSISVEEKLAAVRKIHDAKLPQLLKTIAGARQRRERVYRIQPESFF